MKPEMINHLHAGLKVTTARQGLIANNIANISTPGYKRLDAQFERVLAEALASGKNLADVEAPIAPTLIGTPNEIGNDVDLDQEIGEMVQNASMYKTYFRLLGKMLRQMEMAIGE